MLAPTLLIGALYALQFVGRSVPAIYFLIWFAAIIFAHLFFYSLAVFTTFLTGKPVMQVFLFGFIQIITTVFFAMGIFIMDTFVFGYMEVFATDAPIPVAVLTPPYAILSIIESMNPITEVFSSSNLNLILVWIAYPIFTVALLFFGYLLYRRRRIESAGVVIVHKSLRSIFKYIIGIITGAFLGFTLISIMNSGNNIPMFMFVFSLTAAVIIFGAMGCLFTEMLIKKRFRVWKSASKSILLLTAGIVVVVLFIRLDVVGYERHVPNPNNVVAVSVETHRGFGSNVLFYDLDDVVGTSAAGWQQSGMLQLGDCCEKCFERVGGIVLWTEEMVDEVKLRTLNFFESPEAIVATTQLHRTIIDNKPHLEGYMLQSSRLFWLETYRITYKMDDGRIITRQYVISNEAMESLGIAEYVVALHTQQEVVEKRNRFLTLPDEAILRTSIARATVHISSEGRMPTMGTSVEIPAEALAMILEAMRRDAAEGTMGRAGISTDYRFYFNHSTTHIENPDVVRIEFIYDFAAAGIPNEFSQTSRRCLDTDETIYGLLQTILITNYNTNTMQVISDLGLLETNSD